MDEHGERLMAQYGITAETKMLFHYDGRRYERLADAVNYARMQHAPPKNNDPSQDSGDQR
ncbi:MAG: hypothetical protein P8Y69_06315 [Gammaproteobacteria bacterium]|jgi:hypothetical protein